MPAGYSVKKDNLVVIWLDSEDTPGNLEQPSWPDGTKWASKKEAEEWAKAWLAHNADETKPMPGNSPDVPTIPTPTIEEAEAARAKAIAEVAELHAANDVPESPIVTEEVAEPASDDK